MSEALLQPGNFSEEALAFVKAGTPQPVVAKESPVVNAKPEVEVAPEPSTRAASSAPAPVRRPTRVKEPEPATAAGLVSMSFRLPAEIPAALVRASADRKVRKERPFTQQEIVAEALSQWLKKAGFLGQ